MMRVRQMNEDEHDSISRKTNMILGKECAFTYERRFIVVVRDSNVCPAKIMYML